MKSNHIIVVSETHWDREWYLTFQEFRARLITMLDHVIHILNHNPEYTNFTLDGQTIPLEDYLEIRPEMKENLIKLVREGKLSIGPFYVLPDEFLVSGESLIRNLMIGHQIVKSFGRVMKAGYTPDPFGHIAQLPQILQGFEIPSVIFWRGFGNQFSERNLNIEFEWNAPGDAAKILGIFLKLSYGSVAVLNLKKVNGTYAKAIKKINWAIKKLEKDTATPLVLLNSGTDHSLACPELPEIIEQWNKLHPDKFLELNDFEYYIKILKGLNPKLKIFEGELRGSKYIHILSGVLSSRVWIKQLNSSIENLYEKYVEPIATLAWMLNRNTGFRYPTNLILKGYKWLIKNHPHDSICGCSIDPVYDEMKIRFAWAEKIGTEVIANSILSLDNVLHFQDDNPHQIHLIVYNPLPWHREDIVRFNILTQMRRVGIRTSNSFRLEDSEGNEINYQVKEVEEIPRFRHSTSHSFECCFLASVPACGYNIYYLRPNKDKLLLQEDLAEISEKNMIENQFYQIVVSTDGIIDILEKESNILHKNACFIEDIGDWGDLYDYSGPKKGIENEIFRTSNQKPSKITKCKGKIEQTLQIDHDFNIPVALSPNRKKRDAHLTINRISFYLKLRESQKRIEVTFKVDNQSKDHKLRAVFPTSLKSSQIESDGHFHVISRPVMPPNANDWNQPPTSNTYHDSFIAISDESRTHALLSRGIHEHEPIINKDGTISLAITLLRCVEWLSRSDLNSRDTNAGPDLYTPAAQCFGSHSFELSMIIENKEDWLESAIHVHGQEFKYPLKLFCPTMIKTNLGTIDRVILAPLGILYPYRTIKTIKRTPLLPSKISFISIDNTSIGLSILKKAEIGNALIIRLFNYSCQAEVTRILFFKGLEIVKLEIVNLLEEKPEHEIKAKINSYEKNHVTLQIGPNVIVTLRITYKVFL